MKKKFNNYFKITLKDTLIFLISMSAASFICYALQKITTSDVHVPMIFVLVVLIVSFSTEGYFYGLLSAFVSVFAVNWAFTFPYGKLNFSIYGYPLTFITMLAVGVATSTLAARLKAQEKIRLEAEKEKIRANLLRAVSHDIRTPLTSIGGNISAVLDNSDKLTEEEKKRLLENAREDVNWLYTMVENLLSITKINKDSENELKVNDELIEEIFAETAAKFKAHDDKTKVTIVCPEKMIFVKADAMLIEQVMLNLMDNAVKHGKTTSEIVLSAAESDNMAVISVKDDGNGVDEKIRPFLFNSSMPNSIIPTDKNRFMGIGLSVCKTIVEAHGGEISCESRKGRGAEFIFTLPLGDTIDAD